MKYFWLGFFIFLSTVVFVYKTEIKQILTEKQKEQRVQQTLNVPKITVDTRMEHNMSVEDMTLFRQKNRLYLKGKLTLFSFEDDRLKNVSMVEIAAKANVTLERYQNDCAQAFADFFLRLELRNKTGFIVDKIQLFFERDILSGLKKDDSKVFFEINCNNSSSLDLNEVATITAALEKL